MLTHSLLDALRQHRLLNAKHLEELNSWQADYPDAKALAAELIQRTWLTPYQANQLLTGKGQELVLGRTFSWSAWAKAAWARSSRPATVPWAALPPSS